MGSSGPHAESAPDGSRLGPPVGPTFDADESLPLEARLPPAVLATPADVRPVVSSADVDAFRNEGRSARGNDGGQNSWLEGGTDAKAGADAEARAHSEAHRDSEARADADAERTFRECPRKQPDQPPAGRISRADAGEDIRWWQPGWRDCVQHVGWRWILLTPVIAVAGLYLLSWHVLIPGPVLWILQAKILIFVAAVAVSLTGYVVRRAVRTRGEPFCIFCGYDLTNLPDDYRCPECGRPYTWRLIAEYRRDPHWFRERWRLGRRLPPEQAPFAAGPVPRRRRNRDGTE